MGHGDNTNSDIGPNDLYSRVKLRALNRKVHRVANDFFAAEDGKLENARSRKSSSRISEGVLENNAFYAWRSGNKQMEHQFDDIQDFDKSDLLLDEGTAVEMLDALRRERDKNLSTNIFDTGDLVWGRVKSHPWWPGQVFDEALVSPSVLSYRRESSTLVAFYGDYTYAWLGTQEIMPFDVNYAENSKQTNDKTFLTAVEEAKAEIRRRVVLCLVCHCRSQSDLQLMVMEGDSVKQIQKVRESFCPQEIFYFLKQLALSLRKNIKQNPHLIKNIANLTAFRKAVVRKFNETYAQDVKAQDKGLECPSGVMEENQKASQAPSVLLDADAQVKTKRFKQLTEVYNLQKKDELNVPGGCLSIGHFQDLEFLMKTKEPKFFRQKGPDNLDKFYVKGRAVESEICSRGMVTGSDKAEDLEEIPKDLSEHSSSGVVSSEVEMIRHQVKNAPSIIFPVKTCPYDASGNLCTSSKPLQEQLRPNDLTNAGNKHSIFSHLEDLCMGKPVRLNEMKALARFSANQKLLELQGESQTGISSYSSIQPRKNSQTKQKSIRRDVKERMLTIKFPPQSMLPSVSEVKAKFSCFGPMDEYSTRVFWKSSAIQLVFLKKNDAEAAYHHAIHNSTLFSTSEVRYYLQASDLILNESNIPLQVIEDQKEIQPVYILD